MAQAILEGRKTVTRRRWKRARVKVGSIHKCYTRPAFARPPGKPFARVRIVSVEHEPSLGASIISRGEDAEVEAKREGFASWADFFAYWQEMHGPVPIFPVPDYRVEFALCDPALSPACDGSGEHYES